MEKSEWQREPEFTEPEYTGNYESNDNLPVNLSSVIYEKGGLVESALRINQELKEDYFDFDEDVKEEIRSKIGNEYFQSLPVSITAEAHQYFQPDSDEEDEVRQESIIIDRNDLYLLDIDFVYINDEPRVVLEVVGDLENYDENENSWFAVLPETIVRMEVNSCEPARPILDISINSLKCILTSPTFKNLAPSERRDCLDKAIEDCEDEIVGRYTGHTMEVRCEEFYELEDDSATSSHIPWERVRYTGDAQKDQEFHLDGYITHVIPPEFFDSRFIDNGFKSEASFPISGGVPWLVVRKEIEPDDETTPSSLYFIPIDKISEFRYLD